MYHSTADRGYGRSNGLIRDARHVNSSTIKVLSVAEIESENRRPVLDDATIAVAAHVCCIASETVQPRT
jgi:hypothetical protein